MTDRDLMRQALEALELLAKYENPATKIQVRKPRDGGPIVTMYPHKVATDAAAPLRERLAQPYCDDCGGTDPECPLAQPDTKVNFEAIPEQISEPVAICEVCEKKRPVIHAQRWEWVGLTDKDIEEIARYQDEHGSGPWHRAFARAIEAKLREKNA